MNSLLFQTNKGTGISIIDAKSNSSAYLERAQLNATGSYKINGLSAAQGSVINIYNSTVNAAKCLYADGGIITCGSMALTGSLSKADATNGGIVFTGSSHKDTFS